MWSNQPIGQRFESKLRTDDVRASENVTFDELLLQENILSGLKKSGFQRPSPIQLKAIPLGRCGIDLVVQAKSGTGKTCVFSVICLEAINTNTTSLQAIILAPTREIALQIEGVLTAIGRDIPQLHVQAFIGGTLVSGDRIKAKKCHIAVGSPGRVKQLIELGELDVKNVRLFVLDEADKLMEEGCFQSQINWIYSTLPTNKQMLALSATYPKVLADFLRRYTREPTFVRLNAADPVLLGLQQYYIVVGGSGLPHVIFETKAQKIIDLLSSLSFQQALIFSNYHSRAASLSTVLNSGGWPSTYISGNMQQEQRIEAINQLKEFKCRVLISTDLTSRGIDAHNVDLVINMDIPTECETYMHRIGRAGRFGAWGIAISIFTKEESSNFFHALSQCKTTALPFPGCNKIENNAQSVRLDSNTEEKELNGHHSENPELLKNTNNDLQQNFSEKEAISKIGPPIMGNKPEKEPVLNGNSNYHENKSVDSGTAFDLQKKMVSKYENNLKCEEPFIKVNQSLNITSSLAEDIEQSSSKRKNNTNRALPKILSLNDIVNIDKKQNEHYLEMGIKQLKEDFEYYLETGRFFKRVSIKNEESTASVNSISSNVNEINHHRISNETLLTSDIKNNSKNVKISLISEENKQRPIVAKPEILKENYLSLNSDNKFPSQTDKSCYAIESGDQICSHTAPVPNNIIKNIDSSSCEIEKRFAGNIFSNSDCENENKSFNVKPTKSLTQVTNIEPQETKRQPQANQYVPQVTNDVPQVTKYVPQVTNIEPQVTNRQPQVTNRVKNHSHTLKSISVEKNVQNFVSHDSVTSYSSDSSISTSSDITSSDVTSSFSGSDVTTAEEASCDTTYNSSYYHNRLRMHNRFQYNESFAYQRWQAFQIAEDERLYSENLRRRVAQYAYFITHSF